MNRHSSTFSGFSRFRSQDGAALYVALIMLILLALIGLVGMQVATMQERMSANFMAANQAFQQTEAQVRSREAEITNGTAAYDYEDCGTPFDATAWVNTNAGGNAALARTRNISICTGQCSAAVGSEKSLCNMYRTTALSHDAAALADASSVAAIDTIFIKP